MSTTQSLRRSRTRVSKEGEEEEEERREKKREREEEEECSNGCLCVEVTILKLKEHIRELENTVEDKAAVSGSSNPLVSSN